MNNAVRESFKRVVRTGGMSTAAFRPLPDFLIIGAKRGGTTSLYFDMLEHPAIMRLYPPPVPGLKPDATKGVHYFDSNYFRSVTWYRSYFPTHMSRALVRLRQTHAVAGEASPYYLFHPLAAQRACSVTPNSKVIVQLRDPVMRTYSHWKERRRNNAEPLDFVSALAAEPERLANERERLLADPRYYSYAWEQQSYATQSEYASSLRRWIEYFGRDQVLVTIAEEYYADPRSTVARTQAFLGLTPQPPAASSKRNAALGDDMDSAMRRKLSIRFAEHNHALSALIGRELPWL